MSFFENNTYVSGFLFDGFFYLDTLNSKPFFIKNNKLLFGNNCDNLFEYRIDMINDSLMISNFIYVSDKLNSLEFIWRKLE